VSLKIALIADVRGPSTCSWSSYFIRCGHEVHIISSYAAPAGCTGAASFHVVPIATSYSDQAADARAAGKRSAALRTKAVATIRNGKLLQPAALAQVTMTALSARKRAPVVRQLLDDIDPDLVHALRIPCEGILAEQAVGRRPFIVSTWGNDLTLFARYHPWLGWLTRRVLGRADGLLSDCERDLRLARRWGFDSAKPNIFVPGSGGIQTSLFHPGTPDPELLDQLHIAPGAPVIINPRGFRGYVRNDTFFRAIPLVLGKFPSAVFLCSSMQGQPGAERWVRSLNIGHAVRLLPHVPRDQMARFFRLAQVMVSFSTHDGTPNSMLEAMACGCFPVAGDIESVREWIVDGQNGLLVDSADPKAAAAAMIEALADGDLRRQAQSRNANLIVERADYGKMMARAGQFYEHVLALHRPG